MVGAENLDTLVEEISIISSTGSSQMDNCQAQRYTGAIPKTSPSTSALNKPKVDHLPKGFKIVVDMINKGFRVCVIMRGLPGSGKSFIAQEIIQQTVKNEDHIFSADKYFMKGGRYRFEGSKIPLAHEHTQKIFTQSAAKGTSPLIVDNTNMEYWEMYHYLQVAAQYGYHIEIMEPTTPWKFSEGKLASTNHHGVPIDKIKMMKQKYQTGVGVEELLLSLNLQVVRQPLMRNIPPIVKETPKVVPKPSPKKSAPVKDLIDFGLQTELPTEIATAKLLKAVTVREEVPVKDPVLSWLVDPPPSSSVINPFEVKEPLPVFVDDWTQPIEETKAQESEKPKKADPQPQRKKKNKQNQQSQGVKLMPHRKSCPNENPSFTQIREFYPHVNDSYLWDFFERCNGDADWCVNLLCDDNNADKMDPGSTLTCSCFDGETKTAVPKVKETESPPQPVQSPVLSRKALAEIVKEIDMDEWLATKKVIEEGITFGRQHYPEHVNTVKTWKKGPQLTLETLTPIEQGDSPRTVSTPEVVEELHELPIHKELMLELDEQYGGGMLKSAFGDKTFPPKIFIKKSTAHQLYLEIMEAYYSHEEETKIRVMREDEELAKKLSELEANPKPKGSKKNRIKESEVQQIIKQCQDSQNNWKSHESPDDMALKMSKEKLVEIFPGINKEALMDVFSGNGFNFQNTVAAIQDSLHCTPEERKKIAEISKQIFNTPWRDANGKPLTEIDKEIAVEEVKESYTLEHLKTVDSLRQDIFDHKEEQKVCLVKAQDAIQKRNYELATYLSDIANFHKLKADEAKHQVANMMAGIHEKTQASETTLDLHFLNLVEAVTLLDTFLDKNISRLRAMKKPYEDLFIITGRGLHSANGVATIKNKTKIRLRERNLSSTETNPGLLRVKVFQQSKLSNEF